MTSAHRLSPKRFSPKRRWRLTLIVCLAALVAAGLLRGVVVPLMKRDNGEVKVELPPIAGVFDYQLGGAYDAIPGVGAIDVVVRDATAPPLEGPYNICYVNGFQTQPDEADKWLELEELLLHDDAGQPVVDPEWPDEYVLDPSTEANREAILGVLGPVIEDCASAGYDAVEIDNLDTFTRFDGIDPADTLALAAGFSDIAHDAGLAIAQKNTPEVAKAMQGSLWFDFAIVEECAAWDECGAYAAEYGEHVLQVEYADSLADAGLTFAEACQATDRAPLTILRDRDLVAADDPGYRYAKC